MIKNNLFIKGTTKVSIKCIMENVEGITKAGVYGRCSIWMGTDKDLDWLFRPVFYRGKRLLKLQSKSSMDDNHLKKFKKGNEVVNARCVAETIGTTITTAFHRCRSWQNNDTDIDWLFRPVGKCKKCTGAKRKEEILEKKDVSLPVGIKNEYEIALRKQWGIYKPS